MSVYSRRARALYAYQGSTANELNLKVGDVVIVTEERDDGWWGGHLNGKDGFFPANYVKIIDANENENEQKDNDGLEEPQETNQEGTAGYALASSSSDRQGSIELQKHPQSKSHAREESYTKRNYSANPLTLNTETNDHPKQVDVDLNENWWTRDPAPRCACCPWGGCILSRNQNLLMYCSICSVVSLTIFLIILYAIVPIIINNVIAGSVLSFQSVHISNPNSAQGTMSLAAVGTIANTGGVSAIVGGMTMTVAQVIDGTSYPLGTINMDSLSIKSDPTSIAIATTFQVTNINSFNRFVHSMIFDPYILWHVSATTSVTPTFGSIKMPTYSNINFDKVLNISACNGLLGVTLNVFDLTHSNFTNIIVSLSVDIVNPSIFSIDPMGDLTFDMFTADNQFLGSVFAPNAKLSGPYATSVVNMTGLITPTNLTAVNQLINTFLQGSPSTVFASTPAVASSIPLYNAGMQGLRLRTVVAGNTVNLVQSMVMNAMSLVPSATEDSVLFSASVSILLDSPLGANSPLIVHTLNMNAVMIYNNVPIATLVIPAVPVTALYGPAVNGVPRLVTLNFAVSLVANMLLVGNGTDYENFVKSFLQLPVLTIRIKGTSTATLTYALGNMTAMDFPLDATSTINGMNGLNNTVVRSTVISGDRSSSGPAVMSSSMSLLAAAPVATGCTSLCGLNVVIGAAIFNPSPATVNLPGGNMIMFYQGQRIGQLSSQGLTIRPGANNISLSGVLNPSQAALGVVSVFMSNFLNGAPSTVVLSGEPASSSLLVTSSGLPSAAALTVAGMSLQSVVQQAYVPLMSNFNMLSFGLVFSPIDQSITANGVVQVTLTLPANINMNLTTKSTSLSFGIQVSNSTTLLSMGTVQNTGSMNVTQSTVAGTNGHQFLLTATMVNVPISVQQDQQLGFTTFAELLLNSLSASFILTGLAQPLAATNLGVVSLTNIPVTSTIKLIGYNGFHDANGNTLMTISQLNMRQATPTNISIEAHLSLVNPSQVSMLGAGALTMSMYFMGVLMGQVTIPAFDLVTGTNNFITTGYFTCSPTNPTGQLFLSNYVNQATSGISLSGAVNNSNTNTASPGTSIRLLTAAISNFMTTTSVPGLTSPLITQFGLNELGASLFSTPATIPTTVTVNNPFSVSIIITGGNLLVLSGTTQIGFWIASGLSLQIAPAAVSTTTPINVALLINGAAIVTALQVLFNAGSISTHGSMNVIIGGPGGYATTLNIIQNNVKSVNTR